MLNYVVSTTLGKNYARNELYHRNDITRPGHYRAPNLTTQPGGGRGFSNEILRTIKYLM